MEANLAAYVRRATFDFGILPVEGLQVDRPSQVETLKRAEILYALGDYLLNAIPGRADAAEEHLRAAIALDASHARAHAVLGSLLASEKRDEEANVEFERALELSSTDALPAYLYGMARLDRYVKSVDHLPSDPGTLPAELATVRGLLERSLEIGPKRTEAYVGIGTIALFDSSGAAAGIEALERARSMDPSRIEVPYYLMILYLRRGDRATAERLAAQVLAHSQNDEMRRSAQELLADDTRARSQNELESAYNDAVRKGEAGDLKGGIAALELLQKQPLNPEFARVVGSTLQDMRKTLQEQTNVDEYNSQVSRYNTAMEKAKAGDYAGAIAILQKLQKTVRDPDLSTDVAKLLAALQELVGPQTKGGR
jgi:hypothetical protein